MEIQLSSQQSFALKKFKSWFTSNKKKQVFKLFGYAGTGKTFLISQILDIVKSPIFGTYTGKAAHVLRSKGVAAQTIHSLIYRLVDDQDGKLTWELNYDSKISNCDIVIIDEVSMLNEEMSKDLMSFRKPILVVGDPGQLPPVSGSGFFMKGEPDIMLTEIHRQAKDSPIITLATHARMNLQIPVGNYDNCKVIRRSDMRSQDILETDQILVGRNDTRHSFNRRIRSLLNFESDFPMYNDKVICLKNDKETGILNGSMWYVNSVKDTPNISNLILRDEIQEYLTVKVSVPKKFWVGEEKDVAYETRKRNHEFTYGYAITTHKAQGSQWNNVTVFDESFCFRDDASKWLYTAITRAAEKVTIVI